MLAFILLGCSGASFSDCSGGCYNPPGKNYGKVTLTDKNTFWLSFCPTNSVIQNIPLTNDSGFLFVYSMKKVKSHTGYKINRRPGQDGPCCNGSNYIEDDYQTEYETVSYTPTKGNIEFSLSRKMNVQSNYANTDSFKITLEKEYLELTFKNNYYEINTDSTFIGSKQIFHGQKTLRGRVYKSVFEIIDTKVSTNTIVPQRFYFSFSNGLIGYSLTNGELWLLD